MFSIFQHSRLETRDKTQRGNMQSTDVCISLNIKLLRELVPEENICITAVGCVIVTCPVPPAAIQQICSLHKTGDPDAVLYDRRLAKYKVAGHVTKDRQCVLTETGWHIAHSDLRVASEARESPDAIQRRAYNEGWAGKVFTCPNYAECPQILPSGVTSCFSFGATFAPGSRSGLNGADILQYAGPAWART